MVIKVEMLVRVDNDKMRRKYSADPRNWPQIVLEEVEELKKKDFDIIVAEAYDVGERN